MRAASRFKESGRFRGVRFERYGWALKLQVPRWKKPYKFVMTPLKPGEPDVWPEDQMFALACVVVVHWMRTFHKLMEDPDAIDATLEQLKKDAPPDWVFRSTEELEDDDDQADCGRLTKPSSRTQARRYVAH
jgi:hypothetical protein